MKVAAMVFEVGWRTAQVADRAAQRVEGWRSTRWLGSRFPVAVRGSFRPVRREGECCKCARPVFPGEYAYWSARIGPVGHCCAPRGANWGDLGKALLRGLRRLLA